MFPKGIEMTKEKSQGAKAQVIWPCPLNFPFLKIFIEPSSCGELCDLDNQN